MTKAPTEILLNYPEKLPIPRSSASRRDEVRHVVAAQAHEEHDQLEPRDRDARRLHLFVTG